jgi:acetyl-CoA/propionyl-CoA carboxylase, biotin carboxylase, biotin carboxyl carrier protein
LFSKILIANRGEIAVRVIRTAREMGIATVAVYSDADRSALHVELADQAYRIGPAPPALSYLDADKLIEAARRSDAEAIHPGYGFLSENGDFARLVVSEGLVWIGPHAAAIDAMGDKLRARRAMQEAGVPFVPGGTDEIADVAAARRAAERYGVPLALKASAGGGGKGLKVARTLDEIASAFETARREAQAYFKNGTIYAERYLENAKHVELQLLADKHGNVVHFGERDCSLQRRHQKLWEETPPSIPESVRTAMREAGVRAAKAIGYDSAGTIECLVSSDAFYFLEMNTRIQVEHTVTEMVAGVDLIREQIRVAAGEPLGYSQHEILLRGAAIEARVNAEDPAQGFRPAPGTITAYREPAGPGVRVDSAAFAGWTIPSEYDSLVAKLVVWAPTRDAAIARLRRAIDEYVVEGVPTTLGLLRGLCDAPAVIDATYGTATLELFAQSWRPRPARHPSPFARTLPVQRRTAPRLGSLRRAAAATSSDTVLSPMHGVVAELRVAEGGRISEGDVVAVIEAMKMMNEIRAHKGGVVTRVHAAAGAAIEAGAPLLTLT